MNDPTLASLPPAVRGRRARALAHLRRVALRLRLLLPSEARVRRVLDVVATSLGLLVLAPVLGLAALAVRLESRGPVLFAQVRVARGGRTFRMWKLRTMVADPAEQQRLLREAAEAAAATSGGVRFKMRADPRITRVGRVLRKLSVDELPQLWNVLVGDMTLIGPRPALPREVALYDARALRRLEVEQGLTCFWQVGGRSDLTFDEQVALDLKFVDESTMRDELAILAKTVPAVITGRGAY